MTTPHRLPARRTLLQAVSRRDPAWNGLFVFGVRSTGVACRPTCPSRRARESQLEFFVDLAAARQAGFRPCRRCHPERPLPVPEWWPRVVALVDAHPSERMTDGELARHGFDPVQTRRYCRRTCGMTFHNWVRARRVTAAQHSLRQGASLDQVIIHSGWESHSGFRDAFARLVGAPPGRARDAEPLIARLWHSPLGTMVAAATDAGLALLEFGDLTRLEQQAPALRRHFGGPIVAGDHPHLTRLFQELDEYFAGARREFTVPLVLRGSSFELSVWQALQRIPYGTTCSYRDVAVEIGTDAAVRAVGSANGRNRLPIIIPCHRVVNSDGKLGGYGGGLWRKIRLLELEGAELPLTAPRSPPPR